MLLRFGIAAELIEYRTLRIEDFPIGLIGRMRAAQDLERLVVIAGVSQRAPIGTEHRLVVRIADRSLLQHGNGLSTLLGGAQCPRIIDCHLGIRRIVAITGAPGVDRSLPIRIVAGATVAD